MRPSTASPASPSPSAPVDSWVQPRRPSINSEREILATRGQHLPSLIRRRSLMTIPAAGVQDEYPVDWREADTLPVFLQRGAKLIGESRPVYQWERAYKSSDELKSMKKSLRTYYERTNELVSQYLYIDRLMDSSLPHRLIEDYNHLHPSADATGKVKRTPRNLYRVPHERSPLLPPTIEEDIPFPPVAAPDDGGFVDSGHRIVTVAIYINFLANLALLVVKIVVMTLTNSMSVLASLVDGVLDFLSTAIVWMTTTLIQRQDRFRYPISRRRLEPLSILVFAVVMATSFVQVAITSIGRLLSPDHELVFLSPPALMAMAGTVIIKLLCWFWCRLVKNTSVQALAQDAMTDVVFNLFSILFPLVGFYANWWFLDPLGGLLLSIYIVWNWSGTAGEHIQHLTGTAASPTDHGVLLYMTMRFSKIIHKIQDLKAYYAGDRLNVEVDIVVDEKTSLRDAHDVGESLQYMLESVPTVDRAFVHLDYDPWNIPSHMNQQEF